MLSGSSKFEYAVVACVFGVLATLLLQRLESVQAEAERVQVDLTIRNMRVGMQLAVGELIMHGEDERVAELAAVNPVTFLGRQPEGYEGEARSPQRSGGWSFDSKARELAYRPRLPEAFDGQSELRWRFQAMPGASGKPGGLRLFALT